MKLNAAKRLIASMADEKQARVFLEALGFTGLKQKDSEENRISFKYKTVNKELLSEHVGKPSNVASGLMYKFGLDGKIYLKERVHVVVLRNAESNGKDLKPIETHVPVNTPTEPTITTHKPVAPVRVPTPTHTHTPTKPKTLDFDDPTTKPEKPPGPVRPTHPVQSPNSPGSTENDDSHVPVTVIPPDLEKMYGYCKNMTDASYRLKFNAKLWHYLNTNKFSGRMTAPSFRLLKNVKASSFRMRGCWYPVKRSLEIAPRLYNAHQNFFVEVFLHEMCHQAVSEIDKVHDRAEGGHGPHWKAWMRKVGLNPSRFDPNDNSTYMNDQELTKHNELKDRVEKSKQLLKESNLKRNFYPRPLTPATVLWNGHIMNGLLVCPTVKSKEKWAFLDEDNPSTSSFPIVLNSAIYEYAGGKRDKVEGDAMMTKGKLLMDHYQMKGERGNDPYAKLRRLLR